MIYYQSFNDPSNLESYPYDLYSSGNYRQGRCACLLNKNFVCPKKNS